MKFATEISPLLIFYYFAFFTLIFLWKDNFNILLKLEGECLVWIIIERKPGNIKYIYFQINVDLVYNWTAEKKMLKAGLAVDRKNLLFLYTIFKVADDQVQNQLNGAIHK